MPHGDLKSELAAIATFLDVLKSTNVGSPGGAADAESLLCYEPLSPNPWASTEHVTPSQSLRPV